MQLPDLLGTQLCEMLKKDPATRYIPILMCSGRRDAANGLNAGADDYLIKPCGKDELIARVNALPAPRGNGVEQRAQEKARHKHHKETAAQQQEAAPRRESPKAPAVPAHGRLLQGLDLRVGGAWPIPRGALSRLKEFPPAAALAPLLLCCLFQIAGRLVGPYAEPWGHAALVGGALPFSLWAATVLFAMFLIHGKPRSGSWSNMARVCAAAAAPLALRGLLAAHYAWICEAVPTEFDASPLLLSSWLHGRPSGRDCGGGRLDLFAIWSARIVAVGARRVVKLSKTRAVMAGSGAWALWILAQEAARLAAWSP